LLAEVRTSGVDVVVFSGSFIGVADREHDRHSRTAVRVVGGACLSPVRAGDRLNDREPEAGPAA
jgi:hypothetical protein